MGNKDLFLAIVERGFSGGDLRLRTKSVLPNLSSINISQSRIYRGLRY